MSIYRPYVPENDVFELLSNERRRHSLEYITTNERTTVRELADVIAATEVGSQAPADSVRAAVYVSLRQVHLPRLADAGLIDFDPDTNRVTVLPRARGVTLYLELVTRYGITWGECYQYLGVVGMLAVLGSALGVPGVSLVTPLIWSTVFLGALAATSAYQLWSDRWRLGHHLDS